MYVIGIDYGHGETSAAVLEIDDALYQTIFSQEEIDPNSQQVNDVEDESAENSVGGWNANSIRDLLNKSFSDIKDLKIKGDSKSIKSVLVYDWKKQKWEIGPNISKLKLCISNLDYEEGQYPRMAAYFKGVLVNGKGEQFGSNSLKQISDENKFFFATFIKIVFESIIDSNTIIHMNPRNYRLYIACPSEWDQNQVTEYHRFLQEIGIPCEEVVEESRAAYMSFRNTIIGNYVNDKEKPGVLVIDFGSSTIDFTYFGGGKTINHGYQMGAHKVEERLFNYIIEHEASAKEAFNRLVEEVNGNHFLAQSLLVYSLRNRKELFYTNLAEDGEAILGDIPLKELVASSNLPLITTIYFGFDNGIGYDQNQMEMILEEYINEVKSAFVDFKEKRINKEINYVILTGGASKMPFVKKAAEEVYCVHSCTQDEIAKGKKDTLIRDDEPTFSISQGIAKYGTYRTLSEPLRKAIENRLDNTWRNVIWINEELNKLIPELVHQVYTDKLHYIVDEWTRDGSQIVMDTNHHLYDVLDETKIIVKNKKNDPKKIWDNIDQSRKCFFHNGNHSLHALLRVMYDDIELNNETNRKEIEERLKKALLKKVNEEVGLLFKQYVSIYFTDDRIPIDAALPDIYDIKVVIENSQKINLLESLIENVFNKIDQCPGCSQDKWSFNCDRSPHSGFNATRDQLSPVIKNVIADFCQKINPTFEIDKISRVCKECVEKKFAEIKNECEKEPYTLKV